MLKENGNSMKIGFDGKRALQNFTGLGNYSRYIIEILTRYYSDNSYIIYAPRKRSNKKLESILKDNDGIRIGYPSLKIWIKLSSIWRVWNITQKIRKDKVEVYHGLSNELPLNSKKTGFKKVVTIHDLIFIRFPQYYKPIDRKIYTYKFKRSCINADKIIAISDCTKRDIIKFFRIPEEKIEVVYQNCDPSFRHPVSFERKEEIRKKYQLPEQYILNVGSIEERKNVLLAVKALLKTPEHIHLIIIGKRTSYTEKVEQFIQKNNLNNRVHLLHQVPSEDLPGIYQLAELFVYPSRFEGFGIPIVEALYSGVPVIGAIGSCLEEAGGPDSLYVNPDDDEALSHAINKLLHNPSERIRMIEKGKLYVQRFSDEQIARNIMSIYHELLS